MVTIGDVLAIIAVLVGIGLTSWAMMVSCALLFPNLVSRARLSASSRVGSNIGLGLLMLVPVLAGVIMIGTHNPLLTGFGWIVIMGVLSVGAIGAAGLGHLASETIRRMDPKLEEYPAFVRGSAFLVTASMLPFLGWFAFAPCILLASLGGGIKALSSRSAFPSAAHPVA